MVARSSRQLKQDIREEILNVFGSEYESVTKSAYIAIRKKGDVKNCAAIFGGKGGQSLYIKKAARELMPDDIMAKDVSSLGRGFQWAVHIADDEDPQLGLAVLAVKQSLTLPNPAQETIIDSVLRDDPASEK